jgi:pimeloyl-ACP methyl ester carboxylesterase
MDLWGDQVKQLVKATVKGKYVIVGNSIGSCVSMTAATKELNGLVGLYMVNCAGGMNGLHVTKSNPNTLVGGAIALITNFIRLNFISNTLFDNT